VAPDGLTFDTPIITIERGLKSRSNGMFSLVNGRFLTEILFHLSVFQDFRHINSLELFEK